MASKKKNNLFSNWQENYASFILGAIIVVILGLLVANFLSQRNQGKLDEAAQADKMAEDAKREASASAGEYKIASGDSLSKIAEREYGDKMLWPIIARANNISNPNIIHVDNMIKLPSKEDVSKIKENMTITSYEVKSGDTLFKIAEQVYGNGGEWKKIATANKVGKLPNGNPLIFTGTKLSIPR